jgi:hypothetical protein
MAETLTLTPETVSVFLDSEIAACAHRARALRADREHALERWRFVLTCAWIFLAIFVTAVFHHCGTEGGARIAVVSCVIVIAVVDAVSYFADAPGPRELARLYAELAEDYDELGREIRLRVATGRGAGFAATATDRLQRIAAREDLLR